MINTNGKGGKTSGPNPADLIRNQVNKALDGQSAWPAVDHFRS